MPRSSRLLLLVIHYAQRDARLRFALRLARDAQLRFSLIVARDALLRVGVRVVREAPLRLNVLASRDARARFNVRAARDVRLRVSLALRHEAQLRALVAQARDAQLRIVLAPVRDALLRFNVGATSLHDATLRLAPATTHDGRLRMRSGVGRDVALRFGVRVSGATADPQLTDLAQQTILFEPWAGATSYGDPVYGPPVTLACRIEGRVRMIRSVEGIEMVSTTTIYLLGANQPHVSPRDRITLPVSPFEDPEPQQPPILAVWNMPDETGRTAYQEIATP